MPAVLEIDATKPLIDIPRLIREIEVGFELYTRARDTVDSGIAVQDIQIARIVNRALRARTDTGRCA